MRCGKPSAGITPICLTDELRERIREHILFFQRNVYWRSSVIGRCELEPGRTAL